LTFNNLDAPSRRRSRNHRRAARFICVHLRSSAVSIFVRLALICFLLVATAATARADYEAGAAAFNAGDYAAALREWQPLAEAGDARAQLGLGVLYEAGRGVPTPDFGQALVWYRAAAAQGLPAAQNNLALLYAGGRGVPRSAVTAAELWQSAAIAGYPLAQFNLALAYERGFGVTPDPYAAARWYAAAGNGGMADAAFALSEMYRKGKGVPKHDELARLWRDAARQLGSRFKLRDSFVAVMPVGDGKSVEAATPAPPPQPAAAPTPEPAPPVPDPAGGFAVQLASLPSEMEATAARSALKSKHAALLGPLDLTLRRVDLGADKGVWYRVLAGPFARAQAADLCARLRAAAADCLVIAVK
jgi:hypothetical protein